MRDIGRLRELPGAGPARLQYSRAAARNDLPMEVETRRGRLTDLDEASGVLGGAFVDYPWIEWTVQDDDRLHRVTQLQRTALELLGYPFGQVWVTSIGGEVSSVAVLMDSEIKIPLAAEEQSRADAARLEGARNRASIEAERAIRDLRPTTRHFLLATIGTLPELQGMGLGTRTLATALDSPDVAAVDTYLETSTRKNVAFYERFGFAVLEHRTVATDGPEVWAMIRKV